MHPNESDACRQRRLAAWAQQLGAYLREHGGIDGD